LHNRGNGLEYRVQASRRQAPKRTQTGVLSRTRRLRPWFVFCGAALVALLLYLPTLQYDFVWDDNGLIRNNPFLGRTNPTALLTKGFWHNPEVDGAEDDMVYYRPLTNLSFYVDRRVWGLRPTGYHLTNVAINAAVVFLMCLLLWELFRSVWLSGLGGLLVGIHPAMNCVVTFIANRTYLLALFFLLVSGYALLRGQRDRGRVWPVLFGGSLLLSALALEASLVFAAIAAAWLLVNRARYHKLPAWMAAIASPMAVYFLLRFGVARVPFAGSVVRWAITDPLRVINAFGQQLQLLLFPFNHKVIYVLAGPFAGFSVYTILGLLFLGLPLYAVIRLGRSTAGHRNPDGASSDLKPGHSAQPEDEAGRLGWYGYAWMVLFLLPFAHLVFLGPAGRMLYLAAPGVLILLAALYRARSHKRSTTRIACGAILLCAVVFAVQTLRRNPIWRNELSLSRAMVREAPVSAGGHLNYGSALANAGRKQEAVEQFRVAVAIDPDYVAPHISLAFALIDVEDLPGAIRELREVVRLQPESPKARNDLAVTLRRNGQLDSAIVEYKESLRLDPRSGLTLNNLGCAYLARGDFREAIEQFRVAVGLNPDYVGPHLNLALALMDAEDLPGAIWELREVVRLQPESPKARNDLALTLRRNGQLDSAIVEYKESLRLDPNSELTLNNLGFAYLARGDFREAIAVLKAALRLKPDFAGARGNLADAYRAAGMPDSAALVEAGKW
jgi:Flp pilus assembly protein TadD